MSLLPHSQLWPARRQRAFTLIEIAVVVVILGILIALTLPGYRRINLKAQSTAAMNDLRSFAATFVNSNLQNSRWPTASGTPGDIPAELANGLSVAFTKPSPIGGKYVWISGTTYKAAIGIATDGGTQLSGDLELLEMVDRLMDDGDLSTGSVQLGAGELVYIIEP